MDPLPTLRRGTAGARGTCMPFGRLLMVSVVAALAVLAPRPMAEAAPSAAPKGHSVVENRLPGNLATATQLPGGGEVPASDYAPSPARTASSGGAETDLGTKIFTAAVLILAISGWVAAMVWLVSARRRGATEAHEELVEEFRDVGQVEPLPHDVVVTAPRDPSRTAGDDDGST